MRRAHFLVPLIQFGLAALAASSPAARAHDGSHPPASSSAGLNGAIDPAAASLPLRHAALPASGAVETELTDWRQANAAVGEFPNGHVDILRWEAAQAGRSTPAPSPHGSHMQHGGRP
ncbi:hypothetical protein [Delftia sp. PE138]|uniref:hypothetical protein n=1 Tax=Delftia sp. PE138 TaxID=1812483 RepID=UPI001BAE6854|nr:hypothetical protein [Delftia sp. PE138]MBS3722389.1 hypothetical protein [Delftia sp. PE138]